MPFHGQGPGAPRKGRPAPPEQTSEEAAYLKSLGEKQKPVSIKLADGEVVRGWILRFLRVFFAFSAVKLLTVLKIFTAKNAKKLRSTQRKPYNIFS
jgi:hypothetical protein